MKGTGRINGTDRAKRLVLLDAHAILHRAYHALPDFSTSKGEPTGALYGLSSMLIRIIEDLKPDWLVACYDVKGPTYRHAAFKEYKAKRKKAEDDLVEQINRSRDIFTALGIPIYDRQGYEADDILGTIVEQEKGEGKKENEEEDPEIIIASGDMDTLQLVSDKHGVRVYTLKKGLSDTVMYDEKAVNARYGFGPELVPDYKGLCGDASDNIPGIKGIGDKTATALLKKFGHIEDLYRKLDSGGETAFERAGIKPRVIRLLKDGKEEAEFSKVLATINREVPIEFNLPEKTFREGLDMAKANALWAELEFRALGTRLKQAADGVKGITSPARPSPDQPAPPPSGRPSGARRLQPDPGDEPHNRLPLFDPGQSALLPSSAASDRLRRAAVALWLVNSGTTNPKLEDVLNFAGTEDFGAADGAVFAELDKRGLRKVYEDIELPLMPVLDKMERRGIKVDKPFLAKLSKEYGASADSLEKRIWKEAGAEFNVNSPKQLGEILFDKLGLKAKNQKKTAAGARSTRESELEKLRGMHPVVPLIFEYRELSKLLSTYIDAIPPLLDGNDRLHTHFIQAGAATGRMASEDPNLQNIPVHSELGRRVRHAFVAGNGFKLAAFDYSQVELRIAAFMSGDENLINIFLNGEDAHRAVAARVFGVSADQVTPEMRRRAKVINFGIIYGMGVLALKQNLGTTREEAQKFLDGYFKAFSGLAAYIDRAKAEAASKGYTETFFGRRRYLEGINSRVPYVRAAAERAAVNAPIQGTGADIIKLAMIHVDQFVREEGLEDDVFLLLQVHDELVCEIRSDGREKMPAAGVEAAITDIMQSVISRERTKGVVMEAKASSGDNWGQLK